MAAIRVKDDLHEKIALVAASEGRSAANYLDWIMRPIVEEALGETLEQAASGTVSHPSNGGSRARSGAGVSPPARTSQDPALARQAKLNKAKGL